VGVGRERGPRGPLVLVDRVVAGVPRVLVDSAPRPAGAVDLLLELVEEPDGERDRRHLLPSSLTCRVTTAPPAGATTLDE
jgi:hypothetical protein